MLKSVKSLLEGSSISYDYEIHPSDNPHAFYFDEEFEHGYMRGVIGVHYKDELVHIFRLFPMALPEKCKTSLLEYVARINSTNVYGTFQIDLEDMTLGIDATFLISDDEDYNQKQLNIIYYSITDSLNKYFKGALEVGFGDKDPALVLNKIELDIDPRLN